MNLDQESVGSRRHCSPRHGRNLVPASGPVARIDDDGKVAQLFHHRYGRKIHLITGLTLEGADTPFTQDNRMVTAGHDVFRSQEKLFYGRRHSTLQQNRLLDLSQLLEQVEILHVSGPHLQDVGILEKHRNLSMIHDLRDDIHSLPTRCRVQQLETLLPGTLEALRRSARLECPAAHDLAPLLPHRFRCRLDLLLTFDRARAGHDHNIITSDSDPAHLHDGPFHSERAARQLVRLGDPYDLLHPIEKLIVSRIDDLSSDYTKDRPLNSGRPMDVKTIPDQPVDHLLDLILGCASLHDDDHCQFLSL